MIPEIHHSPPSLRAALCLVLVGTFVLGGCATNPVTGEDELSIIPESQEFDIGRQQYAPMRQAEGGDYVTDPAVAAYVDEIGQRLAKVSDRKLPYEFHVLNSSVPNAWALPGGKIAINRGLLTELNSEAELAAVLGHEIVHAAAKHTVQGLQRSLLLQGAIMAATVAAGDSGYANLAQLGGSVGAQIINQKYGRDAEREADLYGMRYMSRAGYDPRGAVELQQTFVRLSEDKQPDWLSGLFASHPPSQERVQNNLAELKRLPAGGKRGTERYRQRMAGLLAAKPAYDDYEKARRALADKKSAEARRLIDKAIRGEPREGHFYSLLGDIERSEGNLKAARKAYRKAIERNDGFFYYYLQRGLTQQALKARKAAERDLKRSVELLPTANAYKALGDLARDAKRPEQAKQYYAKAATEQGATGRLAYAALVDLDIGDNPDKYLRVRTGVNRVGQLLVEVGNPTPRNIKDITVMVQYPDASGRMRQARRTLSGKVGAGQKRLFNIGVPVSIEQAQRTRASIVGARPENR